MQAPKRKTSRSVRNQRRAHHALSPKLSSKCSHCDEPSSSHSVCPACGYYRGRQLVKVKGAEQAVA